MNTPVRLTCISLFALALGSVHAAPNADLRLPYSNSAFVNESANAYVLDLVKPKYPMSMLERGIQGKVTVKVVVSETGAISDIAVVAASQPEFAEAAREAVNEWLFEPARRQGRTISQTVLVPVSFEITGPDGRSGYQLASM